MADGVSITSSAELERWLYGKPRAWAVAMAARVALRTLPNFAVLFSDDYILPRKIKSTILIFRTTLILSATATGPVDDLIAYTAAAEKVARYVHFMATRADDAEAAYSEAAYAIAAATAAAADVADTATNVARAADAAARAAADDTEHTFWLHISSDAGVLAGSNSDDPVTALLRTPLWSQADTPLRVRNGWSALRKVDALRDAGFAPWFEWYEGLLPLSGITPTDHFGPALTRRIALQPDEWWDRGAKAVNADIAAWLAERPAEWDPEDIPPQESAAFWFTEQGGRIGLAPQDITATNLAAAQAFLGDLRERAAQAAERLESARNAVPFLVAEVTRLRDFLPFAAADLNPFLLRSRLITIDAAVETLQTAGSARELGDDPTVQVTALALAGRELMLCFPDLRTREREALARAIPPGQERQISEALAEASKAAAQAPEVVTEAAAAALDTISTMAGEASDGPVEVQRERIVEQVVVTRNFLSEVARFGWNLWDGVQPGVLGGAKAVAKPAVIFGFAGLVSALTNPLLGAAAVFASYGQINRALKLLEEQFGKRAKELKESTKKPKADD